MKPKDKKKFDGKIYEFVQTCITKREAQNWRKWRLGHYKYARIVKGKMLFIKDKRKGQADCYRIYVRKR